MWHCWPDFGQRSGSRPDRRRVAALWLGLTIVLAGGLWAPPVALLAAAAIAGGAFVATGATWAAWALVAALWALLLAAEGILEGGGRFVRRWLARLATAALLAGVPVALAQLESHFAEEEFFVAVQAAIIGVLALVVVLTFRLLARRERGEDDAAAAVRRGLASARRALVVVVLLGVGALALAAVTVRGYQASFYPPVAPMYAGVSAEGPFLCGTVTPEPGTVDGVTVFEALIAAVAANPHKAAPEHGMLALATGDAQRAGEFRTALLADARAARYTEPANSVKIGQYDASLRVYYYARVRERFPGLFTPDEDAEVRHWLAAVNRRTLTVEWVDRMYGLAFSMWPEGPYENQENGAGLICAAARNGLEAAELARRQRRLPGAATHAAGTALPQHRRRPQLSAGMDQQRLLPDAAGGSVDATKQRLSFEWLTAAEACPTAAWPTTTPSATPSAKTAYLGAGAPGDPRAALDGRPALEGRRPPGQRRRRQPGWSRRRSAGRRLADRGLLPDLRRLRAAQPGRPTGARQDRLPRRVGGATRRTCMLNLRFTGWHRYKASNTVTLMYQGGPVAADALRAPTSAGCRGGGRSSATSASRGRT